MATARGKANQHAYHALILLESWQQQRNAEQLPARVLDDAFGESVQLQLNRAYGWFLLVVAGTTELPSLPPLSAQNLPPVPDGVALPGQLRELRSLEQSGWLGQMQSLRSRTGSTPVTSGAKLGAVGGSDFQRQQMLSWHGELLLLFDRMTQLMDEC